MSDTPQKFDSAGWPIVADPTPPTHIWSPNGVMPIHEYHEHQRQRLDALQAARQRKPPPPPPVPDRTTLMRTLAEARQHKATVAGKVASAEAALRRATDAEAAAQAALSKLNEAEAWAASDLADRLHDWIMGGSTGERPHAPTSSPTEVAARQQAEADLVSSQKTMAALQEALAAVKAQYTIALTAVGVAARAVIRLDAIELAERIGQLEREAGDLWHKLWAATYSDLGGSYIPGDPRIALCIGAPPRLADRIGVPTSRATVRTTQARAEITARFARLVDGSEEATPCPVPSAD